MNCPKCNVELERVVSELHPVLRCPRCSGHLAMQPRLGEVTTPNKPPGDESTVEEALICPRCRLLPMTPEEVSLGEDVGAFDFDVCASCQVAWFDGDELDRLQVDFHKVAKAVDAMIYRRRAEQRSAADEARLQAAVREPRPAYELPFAGLGPWLLLGTIAATCIFIFLMWLSGALEFVHPANRP